LEHRVFSKSTADLIVHADELLSSDSYDGRGELGRMRWYLQSALQVAEPKQALDVLVLLAKYCLRMKDWAYVIKHVETGGLLANHSDENILQLQVSLAAAYVLANMGSASLRCIRPLFESMPTSIQSVARDVIWSALTTPNFIGEENYLWALRMLFESILADQDANHLLLDLHRLARAMEPIGLQEMGTWLRHTLRAEAPGHWFGDRHDRLNYFRTPQLEKAFELSVLRMCEEYKPIIRARLATVLRSKSVAGPSAPSRLFS